MNPRSDLPIIILTHEFYPTKGGIATFTEEIARAASKIGHEVEVWAPKSNATPSGGFPFKVRHLNLKGSQNLTCQIRLALEWVKQRATIRNSIVCLSDPGPILALRYLQFFRACKPARLILTFHGSEIKKFASYPLTKALVDKALKNTDRINVLSEFSRSLLEAKFPASKAKIVVTPGALKSSFRTPFAKEKRTNGPLRILTVGRLHPRKGQALTIDALARLPGFLRQNAELWVVGSGTKFGYDKVLEAKAKKAGLKITFFGSVSDEKLQRLYSSADIFTLTSVNFKKSTEGFGLVYLEAAAYGLPIIANRVGGVSEAVSHEENGILVPPNDIIALTSAFARLIKDDELREEMGAKGIEWSRKFSWISSADLLFNNLDRKPKP